MSTKGSVEAERLAALDALRILDTPEEAHFEAVCRTAKRLFGVPVAAVAFVDADRLWRKTACSALPADIARSDAFCSHAIAGDDVLVVHDASRDPRFAQGILVTGSPGIRFYAGAPLIIRPGIRVGALCLIDTVAREFSQSDIAALKDLATVVVAHLRLHETGLLREREALAGRARDRVIEAQANDLRLREAALEHANRQLTLAEEFAQIGHWRVNLANGQPVWSAGTYTIMGLPAHAPVPSLTELAALYHPDDRERVVAAVRGAIRNGAGYAYEARIVRPDGAVRDISVGGVCERDADGNVIGLSGTVFDITARKRSEIALAESEVRYRELTDALPLLVWTTRTSDGQSTFANACFHDYCGPIGPERSARQALNHPEDRPHIMTAWQRALSTGTTLTFEGRLMRRDGIYRWHKIVMIPIPRADGSTPVEWLGTALDIDEIVSARHRLEHTSDLLRIAQEAADAGAWDYDLRSGIVTLAAESARLYRLSGEGAVNLTASQWTELVHPDDRTPTWEAVRQAVDSRSGYSAEYRIVGGRAERWMHTSGRVLFDAKGSPYRIVGLHFDVTDRKHAEAALKAATAAAEAARLDAESASDAKSDFLAAMSHEIRTPLNGILGYADLLLDNKAFGAEDRHRLELIQSSGAALLTVVNDVLDVSKIEAGALELDPTPFPLHGLVDNTVSIVGGTILKTPLSLSCTIDPSLPAFVIGDEARLRQVLLNLLNNAVKFTPAGSVTLRVRHQGSLVLSSGETADSMRFEVSDTGIGIPRRQHDRLFQKFSQVDGSISRRFGGSGLGLAISKHLVTMMGGEIGFESREGVGSTFWFTLTLTRAEASALAAASGPSSPSGEPSAEAAEPAPASARLLLVEDVEINRELACAVLQANGYAVDVVCDGLEALAAIQAKAGGPEAYDVVLMDIQMPVLDGLTATRRLRALGSPAADVPVVAMTANVLPGQIEEIRRAGMDDHVGKPFKRAELYAAIDRWVGPRAAPRAATSEQPSDRPDAAVDRGIFEAVRDEMGAESVKALLALLEKELDARFAAGEAEAGAASAPSGGRPVPMDRVRIAADAHAMVSAAGTLGFVGFAGLCSEIEAACRTGSDLSDLMARLARLRDGTISQIRTLRAA